MLKTMVSEPGSYFPETENSRLLGAERQSSLKGQHTFWDLLKTLIVGSHDCDLFRRRSRPSGS